MMSAHANDATIARYVCADMSPKTRKPEDVSGAVRRVRKPQANHEHAQESARQNPQRDRSRSKTVEIQAQRCAMRVQR